MVALWIIQRKPHSLSSQQYFLSALLQWNKCVGWLLQLRQLLNCNVLRRGQLSPTSRHLNYLRPAPVIFINDSLSCLHRRSLSRHLPISQQTLHSFPRSIYHQLLLILGLLPVDELPVCLVSEASGLLQFLCLIVASPFSLAFFIDSPSCDTTFVCFSHQTI